MTKMMVLRRPLWRLAVCWLAAVLALGGYWLRAEAADRQQASQALITEPVSGATIRGRVAILGIATHPDFDRYELGFSPEPARGDTWSYIIHYTSRVNQVGLLHTWDTTVLADGPYALRLRVIRRDGNFDEYVVRNLVVANALPTETPTPDMTPTPTPVPTTPVPRVATATISIELPRTVTPTSPTDATETPIAALQTPAGTPGPGSADSGGEGDTSAVPFSLGNLGRAFVQGGLYAVAAFVIVGTVFGVKRVVGWLLARGTEPR